MTVTLARDPTRADFYAAKDFMRAECECPEAARVMKGETDSLLCKPCRVRRRWNELVKAVDES